MPLRSYAVMKLAPSSARLSIGSSVRVERRIAGAVLEVGDDHRHRIVREPAGVHGAPRQHVGAAEQRDHERRRRRHQARREPPHVTAAARRRRRADRAPRPARPSSGSASPDPARGSATRSRSRRRGSSGAIDLTAAAARSIRACSSAMALSASRRAAPPERACRRGSARTRRCRRADRRPPPGLFGRHVLRRCRRWCPPSWLAVYSVGAAGELATAGVRPRASRRSGAARRAGDAEVHDQGLAVGVDHDVGGLEIAMHDAGRVRGDAARRRSSARCAERCGTRQPALPRRAASRDPSPSTYGIVMYLMPSISPRSWMRTTFLCVTCRASSSSRLKRRSISAAAVGIGHDLRPDHLERDGDAELRVPRLIHRAHAADAEQPDDVVAGAELLTGFQGPAVIRRRAGQARSDRSIVLAAMRLPA